MSIQGADHVNEGVGKKKKKINVLKWEREERPILMW